MVSKLWAIEDHLCASCGGRVLRCAQGGGITPGGNPIYKCADCGKGGASLGPGAICWCGFHHRSQAAGAYRCVPFSVLKEYPEEVSQELLRAFRACGCDEGRTEVGIMLAIDLCRALKKREGA